MANELDETTSVGSEKGRDVNVVEKQLKIKVGIGSFLFQLMIWLIPLAICIGIGVLLMLTIHTAAIAVAIVGIIPGLVWQIKKVNAKKYLLQLQQKINRSASSIDNYIEQRVVILKNAAKLLDKAIDLDKDTFTKIAMYRGGSRTNDSERGKHFDAVENINAKIQVAFENYPDLKAHQELEDLMQQNSYLQKEITAAREHYNDVVNTWNIEIYEWPTKMIVAAKAGYTTRIPFSTSREIKNQAREVLF